MDIRSIKLFPGDPRVGVVTADARAERSHQLDGAAAQRVLDAAAPLLRALEAETRGKLRELTLDYVRHSLSVSLDEPGRGEERFEGAAYDRLAPALLPVARAVSTEVRPRGPDPEGMRPSEPAFWSELYRRTADGWELGRPAPPLARWFTHHPPAGKRALVLGCGRGHEAHLLSRHGADVVGIDFAAEAVEEARALAAREGLSARFELRDLFELPSQPARYDLVVEHACFCAIEPHQRADYFEVAADILHEDGELVGLFWSHGREGGPPFSVTREELGALFAPRFELESFEVPRDSVALRKGQEMLVRLRKRREAAAT